ncbi:MAG: efflux RND transporter periplasmic adaptor subunit [Gammaproteobacteria bacterium]|nr:efflux RND transporter periplasmic adaptor subunit [Gammaproteobacteria bacterium]
MGLRTGIFLALLAAVGWTIGWQVYERLDPGEAAAADQGKPERRPVPVEVADIATGTIALRRQFTGTLEARAEFVVSPKVGGRLVRLTADLGDAVKRDEVVALIDDAEHRQALAQAEADLAVARANLAEARSQLIIAERELERIEQLQQRGVSSVSQRDVAMADQLAKQAQVEVGRAQVARAEAAVETARIRLDYTRVRATWQQGDGERVVAQRYVDEGETVSENASLLRIVALHPITAVFHVTERDYALLAPGQRVDIGTDAYPGEAFPGTISRIAPVFREDTRQARVEVAVENPDLRLKPGMYARARVVLDAVDGATIVPERALAKRDGEVGVFVLAPGSDHARWRPVTPGIREAGRVQVSGEGLEGRVVTLGQQLLEDGSEVLLADAGGGPG